MLQTEHGGVGQIIHVEKLPPRRSGSPAGHRGNTIADRLVKAPDQSRQDVTIGGVVVIAWTIEIGGHQADRIETMLLP